MSQKIQPPIDIVPLNTIRTETALSRYPVHRLAKSGIISIEIRRQGENGGSAFVWEVSYNSRYGQPGPLAYKLDTLVVNRRIEEAGRPIPKVIRLGSLREICRELGVNEGQATRDIRTSLFQNASAFINAKITYRDAAGGQRSLEAAFTRYTVILNGEMLPDGRKADGVYLLLNDVYAEVLNAAVLRPLDYDYLKELAPAAQRFYEIVSYQVYAVLRYNLPRARLLYSDFCTYSTLTRHFDYDHVKKQMYKVHKPHLQSGYLARVQMEETVDMDGQADWVMWYAPGAKAKVEYQVFTQRRKFPKMQGQLFPEEEQAAADACLMAFVEPEIAPIPGQPVADRLEAGAADPTDGDLELVEDLVRQGLNRSDARRFAAENADECRRQLAFLPHVAEFKSSRGAYLRIAIEQGFGPPRAYEEQEAQEQERRQAEAKASRQLARVAHEEAYKEPYLAYITHEAAEIERGNPDTFAAFQEHDAERRKDKLRLARGKIGQKLLADFDREESRLIRLAEFFQHHVDCPILSFWDWDKRVNPEPLKPVAQK